MQSDTEKIVSTVENYCLSIGRLINNLSNAILVITIIQITMLGLILWRVW